MSYSKKSKSMAKIGAARILADAFAAIRAVAVTTSEIDSRVVEIARNGVKAAADCLAAETDRNKGEVTRAALELARIARQYNATPTPMVRAAFNMGAALKEFRANEYGQACVMAINAMDNVK